MMQSNWQVEINSLEARLDTDFETYFPRHLRAELVGQVRLKRQFDHPGNRLGFNLSGSYSSGALIEACRDAAGTFEIKGFRLNSGSCLVLRSQVAGLEMGGNPEGHCSAAEIEQPFKLCLESYLLKRYVGQPVSRLLPNSDAVERLKEQEDEIAKFWRDARRQRRRRVKDDADWWKRGEEPPY